MSESLEASPVVSHAEFLDATATLAVSALTSLRFALALSATLLLSACASSCLELATVVTAGAASGDAAGAGKAGTQAAPTKHAAANKTARGLRANGDLAGGMSALEAAAKSAPDDITMLRERGLLALEMGQISDAKALLTKADAANPPDWRIKSALDSADAASGDQAAAQCEFAAAPKLVPDHPSILSYALDGRRDQAEKLLRTAARGKAAAPKAKQNLALLLGLNGNLYEARKVSEASLSKEMVTSPTSAIWNV
jgi:Flp pilus assembly protein TadD